MALAFSTSSHRPYFHRSHPRRKPAQRATSRETAACSQRHCCGFANARIHYGLISPSGLAVTCASRRGRSPSTCAAWGFFGHVVWRLAGHYTLSINHLVVEAGVRDPCSSARTAGNLSALSALEVCCSHIACTVQPGRSA